MVAEVGMEGFSSLSLAPPPESVRLPSHRLVGELAHPIELLLHLVSCAFTPSHRGGK